MDLLLASSECQRLAWENEVGVEGVGWRGRVEEREGTQDHSDIILVVFWQVSISYWMVLH